MSNTISLICRRTSPPLQVWLWVMRWVNSSITCFLRISLAIPRPTFRAEGQLGRLAIHCHDGALLGLKFPNFLHCLRCALDHAARLCTLCRNLP